MDALQAPGENSGMAFKINNDTTLASIRDANLTIGCQKCFHMIDWSPASLAALIGWNTRIIRYVPQMRCSKCGEHQALVTVYYDRKPHWYTGH